MFFDILVNEVGEHCCFDIVAVNGDMQGLDVILIYFS
jgi:hypothetical protein